MGSLGKGKVVSLCLGLAAVIAAAVVVFSGQVAGAHPSRQIKSVKLLSMAQGTFEISLGTEPSWLPLSGTAQTLTLIGGAPKKANDADNAYVGFIAASKSCAATPKKAKDSYELTDFYASGHSAAVNAGAFAPNGGAPRSTFIDSVSGVRFSETGSVRACIWMTTDKALKAKKPKKSLAASLVLPVMNSAFAASVSNLTGATAGSGGYTMYAAGGRTFSYSVATTQCARTSTDSGAAVAVGTPASETVSISVSPCSGDLSTFKFSGANTHNASLEYPVSDALANPPMTLSTGDCELDPLTGVLVTTAEAYLTTVGCSVGELEVSPYQKSLPRGAVSWVSVDGGVADLAPTGTAVDLVVNG